MHAYLIVSNEPKLSIKEAQKLSKRIGSEIFKFDVSKIEDVRNLQKFIKFTLTKPTSFLIENIENATVEALNAFLKNLEEPQKNASFILTTTSLYKILPTIVSRCQIIKIQKSKVKSQNFDTISSFLKMSTGEKLANLEKIRQRSEAILFIQDFINACHSLLLSKKEVKKYAKCLKQAQNTLNALNANGNVNLQLTNFVISIN